jgi:uncharacterized protein YlzI (FlbEa/FlbD family)
MEILLNVCLIKSIEETSNTVITLSTGDCIRVKNTKEDIMEKIRAYCIGQQDNETDNETEESIS